MYERVQVKSTEAGAVHLIQKGIIKVTRPECLRKNCHKKQQPQNFSGIHQSTHSYMPRSQAKVVQLIWAQLGVGEGRDVFQSIDWV